MHTQSKIERQVMASVAVIYAARALMSATAAKIYALVISIWAFGALVWVAHVEQNFLQVMHGGAFAVGNFALSAFAHTRTLVQFVVLVAIFALGSLVVDMVRLTTKHQTLVA
jgi:aminopeptidase-like protein